MKKRGPLKISENFFFSILQVQKISMHTTRVVFGNFEGDLLSHFCFKYSMKLNWKFQGGWGEVAGSNLRTILRGDYEYLFGTSQCDLKKMFSN